MSIRSKLAVIAECEKHNKLAIMKYLDRSPIYKRSDPRYQLKLKLNRIREKVAETAPEVIALLVFESIGIVAMPFVICFLMGGA